MIDGPGLRTAPGTVLLAAYELRSADARFGGISALALDDAGVWLLGDRGTLWRAEGRIDPASGSLDLARWRGATIHGDARDALPLDSEALALAADGTLIAGFEHDASLRRLLPAGDGDWRTARLHDGPLISGTPRNSGLEAAARLADGTLVALAEGARPGADVAAGARLVAGETQPFGYRAAPGFSPVGADATATRLYVLERAVSVLGGWQTRLVAVPLDAGPPTGTLVGQELLRLGAGPLAENYEGVAVRANAGAGDLVVLAADDNFSALQRTLLLVLSVAD